MFTLLYSTLRHRHRLKPLSSEHTKVTYAYHSFALVHDVTFQLSYTIERRKLREMYLLKVKVLEREVDLDDTSGLDTSS